MDSIKSYIQIRVSDFLSQLNILTEDRKYIKGVRFRKVPNEVVQIITKEAYKTSEYPNILKKHLIATYEFETYQIELDTNENINITEIQLGSSLNVVDENNIWYQCSVFSIEQTEQADTSLYSTVIKLEILYKYQNSGANKELLTTDQFVHDFVTYDYLHNKWASQELYELHLSNYEAMPGGVSSFTISTKFFPKKFFTEDVYDKTVLENGDENINKKIGYGGYILTAFLDEDEKIKLETYGNLCYYKLGTADKGIILNYDISVDEDGIKPIDFEFEENTDLNNLGIYKVKITIFTSKLNYSPNLNKV